MSYTGGREMHKSQMPFPTGTRIMIDVGRKLE